MVRLTVLILAACLVFGAETVQFAGVPKEQIEPGVTHHPTQTLIWPAHRITQHDILVT